MNKLSETKQGLFVEMHHPVDKKGVMNANDAEFLLKEGALSRQNRVHLARSLLKKFQSPHSSGISMFLEEVERRHNKLASNQILDAVKREFEVVKFIESTQKTEDTVGAKSEFNDKHINQLNMMMKGKSEPSNRKKSETIPDVFHQAKAELNKPKVVTNLFGGFVKKPDQQEINSNFKSQNSKPVKSEINEVLNAPVVENKIEATAQKPSFFKSLNQSGIAPKSKAPSNIPVNTMVDSKVEGVKHYSSIAESMDF